MSFNPFKNRGFFISLLGNMFSQGYPEDETTISSLSNRSCGVIHCGAQRHNIIDQENHINTTPIQKFAVI